MFLRDFYDSIQNMVCSNFGPNSGVKDAGEVGVHVSREAPCRAMRSYTIATSNKDLQKYSLRPYLSVIEEFVPVKFFLNFTKILKKY